MRLLAFLIFSIPSVAISMSNPEWRISNRRWHGEVYAIIKKIPRNENKIEELKKFLSSHQKQSVEYANGGNYRSGQPILIWACKFKYVSAVKVLLESIEGINANAIYRGNTPLIIAIKQRNIKLMDVLLSASNNAAAVNFSEVRQPIFHALVGNCSCNLIQKLMEYGADFDVRDACGKTPMHVAVESSFPPRAVEIIAQKKPIVS
ncbi:MAG: ankyrin repeat domain-containing protein [Holosporaceae bacterium]|jgi:hypothetical protein|nr:ankyrin repeat domain-containing protein [Holosporaceae bacterium]